MYTVLRFYGADDKLERVGTRVNETRPDEYDGPDKVGGRFSISLSRNDDWSQHLVELREQLEVFRQCIQFANQEGCEIQIDTAVYWDDYRGRWVTSFDFGLPFLAFLHDLRIEICVSVWADKDA